MIETIEASILGDQDERRGAGIVADVANQVRIVGSDQKADEQQANDVKAELIASARFKTYSAGYWRLL